MVFPELWPKPSYENKSIPLKDFDSNHMRKVLYPEKAPFSQRHLNFILKKILVGIPRHEISYSIGDDSEFLS